MDLFVQATALASAVVLLITELLKLVPVAFTTKYPAWVNAILSVIAAFIVVDPVLTFVSVAQTVGTALYIAVVAAVAYNQFAKKLKEESTPPPK